MNTDQALDRILGAINATAAPEHLEQRLQARLAAHKATKSSPRWSMAWLAVPAICAVVVGVVATHHHDTVAPVTTVANTTPAAATPRPTQEAHSIVHITAHTTAITGVQPAARPVDDAFLPSMPAPAQPLTEDERKLRRMALPQSPTILAEVEPMRELERREEAAAGRRREFDRYATAMLAPLVANEELRPTPSPESTSDQNATTENQ